jgi:hypothetical protein
MKEARKGTGLTAYICMYRQEDWESCSFVQAATTSYANAREIWDTNIRK